MSEEVSVAVTLDHAATDALKVTGVGSLGTEGRESIQRRWNCRARV